MSTTPPRPERVTLTGTHVCLEPMTPGHAVHLWEIATPDLFRYYPSRVASLDDMQAYVESALRQMEQGEALPFVTVERASGRIVGSTRFAAISFEHRRVEIGWTWITPAWQRTFVNTEAKYLMLQHAFGVWGCARVEFKADVRNERSAAALQRIGAVREGVLRSHMSMPDGARRDTVYFSVLENEWPAVKLGLEHRLARNA